MLRWLHAAVLFMCLHNTYHFCRVCLLSSVCSILATPPCYCVLLHERQLVQYDEEKKTKKQAQFPNQLLMSSRKVQQQGADPSSCSACAAWPPYMQMAPRSQISFEVIKSLHCSLQKGGVLAAICQPDLSDYSLQLIAVPLKAFKAVNCSEIYCKHKNYE